MLHKMGYDCQCDTCGKACMFDDVDEDGDCEACVDARIKREYARWRPLYEGEKRAGLLKSKEELNADLRDAGRGHLIGE